jgi:Astacin (Peptidase family M12A)/Clostridial hydrophobic W
MGFDIRWIGAFILASAMLGCSNPQNAVGESFPGAMPLGVESTAASSQRPLPENPVRTWSTDKPLSQETKDVLTKSRVVIHTFSNGKTIKYINDDGYAIDFGGHIIVAKISDLPMLVENYELRLKTPETPREASSKLEVQDLSALNSDASEVRPQGVGVKPNSCVYSLLGGVCLFQTGIPYIIDSSITGSNYTNVMTAINQWNASSIGVKFRPRTSFFEPWAYFQISGSCSAFVGRSQYPTPAGVWGGQPINLANATYCIGTPGTIMHEMGHTAGLFHEQQRCDRDNFLIVTTGDDLNSGKRCENNVSQYGKFNFDSVMLYYLDNFTGISLRSGLPSAPSVSYDGNPLNAGQRANLSAGDINSVNEMYQLPVAPNAIGLEAYGQNYAWQQWVANGFTAKAARAGLTSSYQAHIAGFGWLPAVNDGGVAGTTGQGVQLEALSISLGGNRAGCSLSYRVHVAGIGWMGWVSEGAVAGTIGQSRRIEAMQTSLSCD